MSAAPAPAEPLDLAVAAALRGVRGANPLVGAVLTGPLPAGPGDAAITEAGAIAADDSVDAVLAVGRHRGRGTAHAEADALDRWAAARAADPVLAAVDPADCVLHVTLEPCDHTGSTGPCTGAILAAGIGTVRYAVPDATGHDGGGAARLRAAGVRVVGPVPHAASEELTAHWRRVRDAGRPWVTAHLAQSLDGMAAAADGTSRWITGPAAREHAHAVRSRVDAIVVGTGTVAADDPRLTARDAAGADLPVQPVPVVQGRGDLPAGAVLAERPDLIHVRSHDPHEVLAALAAAPGPWPHGGARAGHVLIEGGPRVLGAWLAAGLVDELFAYTAPVLLGEGRPAVVGLDVPTLAAGQRWIPDPAEDGPVRPLGADVLAHFAPPTDPSTTDPSTPDPAHP